MSCAGRFWGTIIGAALGHLPGAIVGFLIGYFVIDLPSAQRRPEELREAVNAAARRQEELNVRFIRAVASMLAKTAKADGRVTEEEIQVSDAFFTQVLRLDGEKRRIAVEAFRKAKDSPLPIEHYAKIFRELVGDDVTMRREMLHVLVTLARSDGRLDPNEMHVLERACRALDLPTSYLSEIIGTFADDFSKYYAVLGCSESDSDETIKERYRRLVKEYHPDVIAGKGLPQDFVDFATRRFQEIQEAYSKIKAARGFR